MEPAAAFFDVDHTLVVGTSLEQCFLRQAWREHALPRRALWRNVPAGLQALGFLPAGPAQRIPIPPNLALPTRLRYAFLSGNKAYLRGLPLEKAREIATRSFFNEVLPRLSPRGGQRLDEHRRAGRSVILLTGTLDFLGEPLRAYLQADRMLAACPEVRDGVLTGRLSAAHPYGDQKRALLRAFAAEQGLALKACYAYADHHTDVPFMEAVGHPVAVNPDRRLAQIARERGWPIERW